MTHARTRTTNWRRALSIAGSAMTLAGLVAVDGVRPHAQAAADMVLTNGTILTVDASDSTAEAVAIAGGRIVAVGTSDAIKGRIGTIK